MKKTRKGMFRMPRPRGAPAQKPGFPAATRSGPPKEDFFSSEVSNFEWKDFKAGWKLAPTPEHEPNTKLQPAFRGRRQSQFASMGLPRPILIIQRYLRTFPWQSRCLHQTASKQTFYYIGSAKGRRPSGHSYSLIRCVISWQYTYHALLG